MNNYYPRHFKSAATVNATLVRGAPSRLGYLTFTNVGTTCYLKVYDKATAPAATDTPVHVFTLPNGAYNQGLTVPPGIFFSLGFGFRITGALADADATAIGANDVVLNYGID